MDRRPSEPGHRDRPDRGRWRPAGRLLQSLDDHPGAVEVLVVDNGSADPAMDALASRFPNARVIRLDHNAGYSRAVNLAAREATGDALVLVNDDCVCDPGFVEAIMAPLDPIAGVTMAAGVMREVRDPTRIDTAGMQLDRTLLVFDYLNGEPAACLDNGVAGPDRAVRGGRRVRPGGLPGDGRLRREAVRLLGGCRPRAADAAWRGTVRPCLPRARHPLSLRDPRLRLVREELSDRVRSRLHAAQVGSSHEARGGPRGLSSRTAWSVLGSWSSIAASPECAAGFAATGPPCPPRRFRAKRLRIGVPRMGPCGRLGGARRGGHVSGPRRRPGPGAASLACSRSSTWRR